MGEIAEMMLVGMKVTGDGFQCGGRIIAIFPKPTPIVCPHCLQLPRACRGKLKRFVSAEAVEQHVRDKHPPASCPDCRREFKSGDAMRQHRADKHGVPMT